MPNAQFVGKKPYPVSTCSVISRTNGRVAGLKGLEIIGFLRATYLRGFLAGFFLNLIELLAKGRPCSVFKFTDRIWWTKAKGTRVQNDIYCMKDDKEMFEYDPHKVPEVKTIHKANFYPWQTDILKIIETEPDDRKIYWYWSEKGRTGKTSMQKYLAVKHGALILGGKACDVRNAIVEYKKTNHGNTPKLICCNIPRSFNKEYVSYEGFENIKDMCFYSGKYEGGMVVGNPPHLFIFANIQPEEEKLSDDRLEVVCLD